MFVKDSKLEICNINSLENNKRLSTQELLQLIYQKIDEGYTQFKINACGQHNIGGPLWVKNKEAKLKFIVNNPGQRVGSMGMKGTSIIVEGSAPADVGWLNAGAEIIVKGDGGDTTGHCAASGKIFIGGRVGTRSGSLMKHDPKFDAPQLWVLKNTGSFSFEFMGGGIAVICGLDCENMDSVLGHRCCVGMVGGTIYVRGNISDISESCLIEDLNEYDISFLNNGIREFLDKINKPEEYKKLSLWNEWKKIVAKPYSSSKKSDRISLKDFREKMWVEGGIFGDFYQDDLKVEEFITKGDKRLRIPYWNNNKLSAPCEFGCPIGIPTQKRINLIKQGKIKEAVDLIFDYSPFPASVCGEVCPQLCMDNCSRCFVDEHIKISDLAMMSRDVKFDKFKTDKKEKIAIVGSGVAGLSCAWILKQKGFNVEVFEEDTKIGGKLTQVIPNDRLTRQSLNADLNRIKNSGIKFNLNKKIKQNDFQELEKTFDAIVIAVGAHTPFVIPFEGHQRLIKGLDFLKTINRGEKFELGKKVVIIGAGNAAMDVIIGAYQMGACEVTAIDIQKPMAFEKEINHAQSLGAKILWPCYTDKITKEGVWLKDGTLIEADNVIISIGDRPNFDFIDRSYLNECNMIKINEFQQCENNNKVFAIGDSVKQGLFTNAIADGRKCAFNIINMFENLPLNKYEKRTKVSKEDIKPEYYATYSPLKVQNLPGYEEDKRCLSCATCRDCEFCLNACPTGAIEKFKNEKGETIYTSNIERCIGCGVCAGVCPCGIWTLQPNSLNFV